jgi:hypothetical protein
MDDRAATEAVAMAARRAAEYCLIAEEGFDQPPTAINRWSHPRADLRAGQAQNDQGAAKIRESASPTHLSTATRPRSVRMD